MGGHNLQQQRECSLWRLSNLTAKLVSWPPNLISTLLGSPKSVVSKWINFVCLCNHSIRLLCHYHCHRIIRGSISCDFVYFSRVFPFVLYEIAILLPKRGDKSHYPPRPKARASHVRNLDTHLNHWFCCRTQLYGKFELFRRKVYLYSSSGSLSSYRNWHQNDIKESSFVCMAICKYGAQPKSNSLFHLPN